MSDELLTFPRGALAMDNGDLVQITNVKVDQTNGAKLQYVMRKRNAAGVILGNEGTTLSFDAVVDENGPERDYLKMVRRGTIKKLRVKIPGETFTVLGVATKRSLELPTDDAIKYSIEFIGNTE